MTVQIQIQNLATRIGTEFKALRTLVGGSGAADVSALTTTATNLVAAINEVKVIAEAAAGSGGAQINDVATNATETWSSNKIDAEIVAQVNAAIDGAPAALDTLNEIAAAIGDDANFAATMTTALGNRVRFDAPQSLTNPQQLQACQNIGVGDPETDFVAVFEAGLT